MQTLIVYELVPESTKFFLVDGDRSDLNGCFVNTVETSRNFSQEIQDEVSAASTWGEGLKTPLKITQLAGEGELIIVHCGFIL